MLRSQLMLLLALTLCVLLRGFEFLSVLWQ